MFSKFIHILTCIGISFIFHCQIIFHCIVYHIFIYPLISHWIYLGYFYFLDTINNIAMNFCIQILCGFMFLFILGIYFRVGLLRSDYKFSFLRNCQATSHTHPKYMRVPITPHPRQHFFSILLYPV